MKTKLFNLILLTAIVLTSLVSAATFTATLDGSFTKADNTVVLTIRDTSGSANTVTVGAISDITDGTNSLSISGAGTKSVPANGSATLDLVYTGDTSAFALGTFTTDVVLTSGSDNRTLPLNFESSFCDNGIVGQEFKLDIKKFDIKNTGYGEEDNEWYPLDDVEIELRIENDGSVDIDDVTIEACLYDIANDDCVMDEDDMELSDTGLRIKDGDEETVLFNFKVDPDLLSDETDYVLYVKAFDDDLGESVLCTEETEDITVIRDKHFVILDNIAIPESISCGETVDITADVWNIGEEDEDDVYVLVSNNELKINGRVDIGTVDALEKEQMLFNLQVPEGIDEKSYTLRFSVYDEDDDIFENDNDDKAEFTHALKVEGNCEEEVTLTKDAAISAALVTENVQAGKDVTIRATIRNSGEEETSYSIQVEGHDFFSTLQSINPSTLTLQPGRSQDVLITLKLNSDAAGEQVFNIKALFDSQEVKQGVSLNVPQGVSSITGSAIGSSIRENWFIWVIVLINIILIIAIIIVAARMSRA